MDFINGRHPIENGMFLSTVSGLGAGAAPGSPLLWRGATLLDRLPLGAYSF
jgi:hypothetical protein